MSGVWALWVRGRLRPRIELADGGDDALAELMLRGGRRGRGARAVARDGACWDVSAVRGGVEVRRDGVTWFRADGRDAVLGDERLTWDRQGDALRRATVRRADGSVLLRVRPGEGRRGPFATIELSAPGPASFPLVLGVGFVLLEADAVYGSYGSAGAGGVTGP